MLLPSAALVPEGQSRHIAGAIRLAEKLGPGKTIVTILADSASRYQSKLFNPGFLRSQNLPIPKWMGEE